MSNFWKLFVANLNFLSPKDMAGKFGGFFLARTLLWWKKDYFPMKIFVTKYNFFCDENNFLTKSYKFLSIFAYKMVSSVNILFSDKMSNFVTE